MVKINAMALTYFVTLFDTNATKLKVLFHNTVLTWENAMLKGRYKI